MLPREQTELFENQFLSPYASKSRDSWGRERAEEECDIRTCYQRDRDRIIHCKSFRRLKHKTQVFLSPEQDHYRTRLTHTLEVSQVARTIACALRLNENLAEAIAMGHDLGHTPFGHAGERVLNRICPSGFAHNEQSLRVVEVLEKERKGLNLTSEVRDGILHHNLAVPARTPEGQIVQLADHIAYVNHDIDDAIRGKILFPEDIPYDITYVLGRTHSRRIDTMIRSVIEAGQNSKTISMTKEIQKASDKLHGFLFESVYTNPKAKGEETKAEGLLEELYEFFMKHPDKLPGEYLDYAEQDGRERVVCDYLAGMTDPFAVAVFQRYFVPSFWQG